MAIGRRYARAMTDEALSASHRAFVLRFGEIGRGFGLTKAAAQVWAFALAAKGAPSAAEIAAGLGIARSNVSTALKELRGLGLLRAAPAPGERQERFAAPEDPAEAAAALAAAFRARVIDPAAQALAGLGAPQAEAYSRLLAAIGPALEAAAAAPTPAAPPVDAPTGKKKKKKK